MAKSLPRVRPGIQSRAHDLLSANILMFLVDNLLKDDAEGISVGDLAALTREPKERVLGSLEELTARGMLTRPGGEHWPNVGLFKLGQLRIGLLPASKAEDEEDGEDGYDQYKLDLRDRTETMRDKAEIGLTIYEATVSPIREPETDGLLYFALKITARDIGEVTEPITKVDDPEKFSSVALAFEWWDEWVEGARESAPVADPIAAIEKLIEGGFLTYFPDGTLSLSLAPRSFAATYRALTGLEPIDVYQFVCTERDWAIEREVGGIELEGFAEPVADEDEVDAFDDGEQGPVAGEAPAKPKRGRKAAE